jgi:hypothetical protein
VQWTHFLSAIRHCSVTACYVLNEVSVATVLWNWINDATLGCKRCQQNCEQWMLKVTGWRRHRGSSPFIKSLVGMNWSGNQHTPFWLLEQSRFISRHLRY